MKKVGIIGNFELAIKCAKLLQEHKFDVYCIFSENPLITDWALVNNVLLAKDLESFFNIINQSKLDYLFSIQNPFIIPNEIITKIKFLSINYHNSLLPLYGGSEHNVSWMIWNNEEYSGVTWHSMTGVIDGGDILEQVKFPIDKNETASSLLLKSHELAISTFKKLLINLKSDNLVSKPQNFNNRSFFYSYDRPCGLAIISWNNNADFIWRQFRALNFEPYSNSVTTLKFKYKGSYFAVLGMECLTYKTYGLFHGTVISKNYNTLQISTNSLDILLTYTPISPFKNVIFDEGTRLEEDKILLNQQVFAKSIAIHESYWKMQLLSFFPGKNFIRKSSNFINRNYKQLFKITFEGLFKSFEFNIESILLTLIFGYLYKVNNYERFSVAIMGELVQTTEKINDLLMMEKFLNINFGDRFLFSNFKSDTSNMIKVLKSKQPIFQDLLLRYPEFNEVINMNSLLININYEYDNSIRQTRYPIIIDINSKVQSISLFISEKYIEEMPLFLNFMAQHLKILSHNWITQNQKLNKIDLLSSRELEYLNKWNDHKSSYPIRTPITQLIDKICARYPDHIALESIERQISYKQLKQYSDTAAKNILFFLDKNNVDISNFNSRVGVFLDKSTDSIIVFLAALKAGLTYISLDTSYPDTYIKNILDCSNIQIFIGSSSNVNRLSQITSKINTYSSLIFLELEKIFIDNSYNIKLSNNSIKNKLAYIIFTSGSTGKPKGIAIKQKSVINLAYGVISTLNITTSDKILQFSNLAFDACVWEIYATLLAGGTLYIPNILQRALGDNLEATIVENKISILLLTPSALKFQPYFESCYIKVILTGGEACTPDIVEKWGQRYKLINAYGPAECTVITSMSSYLKPGHKITIGKPIQNYQIMICDIYNYPLPLGAIGEIVISGAGIAQEYIDDIKLTRKIFKKINFSNNPKKITYLSGDLGLWNKLGEIEFIGRESSLIKVRGFRVETQAIKECFIRYPGIKECFILPETKDNKNIALNAYILPSNKDKRFEITKFKMFLKDQLPDFMIPSKFFIMDNIPLTESGKTDYKKIIQKNNLELTSNIAAILPTTTIQKEIMFIWQNILDIQNSIDIYESFYNIGGSSLRISQMISELQKKYTIQIPTTEFLRSPNIKNLENIILNTNDKYSGTLDLNELISESIESLKNCINKKQPDKQLSRVVRKIFLTGVTGFLGSFVAKYFLERNIEVFCLVRPHSLDIFSKVSQCLKKFGWQSTEISKLNLIEGDFTKENFGLEEGLYNKLANEIDLVCNVGAFVHHLFNYEQLKAANINSVINCIKFAHFNKFKYFAHISTLSILNGLKDGLNIEDFINKDCLSYYEMNGYNTTKLVAEICINEAVDSLNLNTKIYRPGWIVGNSTTGSFAYEKNHLFLLIKGCLQLGYAPDWSIPISIMPVDYIAKFIVNDILSNRWNIVYNMAIPSPLFFDDLLLCFAKLNKVDINFVKHEDWQLMLNKITPDNALYSITALYSSRNKEEITKTFELFANVKSSNFVDTYSKLKLPNLYAINKFLPLYNNFLLKKGFFSMQQPNISSFIDYLDKYASSMPGPIYWKDKHGVYLGMNELALQAFGFEALDSVVGKTDYDLWPDFASKIIRQDRKVLRVGQSLQSEESIIQPTGEMINFAVTKCPLKDNTGNIIGIIGSFIDITEQKRNSLYYLEALAPSMPGPIYWKDRNSVYCGMNDFALKVTGRKYFADIIGKTDYDLWPEVADELVRHDQEVITTGQEIHKEEIITTPTGEIKYFTAIKVPLRDDDGNIIGIIGNSIEITAEKEAEQLRIENEAQNKLLEQDAKFRKIVEQVVHDIRSPIATLQMILPNCEIHPEDSRVAINQSATKIQYIASQLLTRFKPNDEEGANIGSKKVSSLISADIIEIIAEKKFEYNHLSLDFVAKISQSGHFAFIDIDIYAFRRMMSNLINNAVDALSANMGVITVHLNVDDDMVKITVEDDGCGMPEAVRNKILNNIAVTEGKEDGHGIGFGQIRDTLMDNEGILAIESEVGKGTRIILTFPQVEAPNWICSNITLDSDDFLIILDDDPSIHGAWDSKFGKVAPGIKSKHFERGDEAVEFINNLSEEERSHIFILTDFELLKQGIDGLDVVSKTGISRSVLVTSHHNNENVRNKAKACNTKILPKPLAAEVPILINTENKKPHTKKVEEKTKDINTSNLKVVDLVLIDDDKFLTKNLMTYLLKDKNVDIYNSGVEFLKSAKDYDLETRFLIDLQFKGEEIDGLGIAKELHNLGYKNLYLFSGMDVNAVHAPDYLKVIEKTDINSITNLLKK